MAFNSCNIILIKVENIVYLNCFDWNIVMYDIFMVNRKEVCVIPDYVAECHGHFSSHGNDGLFAARHLHCPRERGRPGRWRYMNWKQRFDGRIREE